MDDAAVVVALTTLPAGHDCTAFAGALVEAHVAACVQVHAAMTSVYRWEGQVTADAEHSVVIKTTRAAVPALWNTLRGLHPYDVPQFVVIPAIETSPEYGGWVRTETKGAAGDSRRES